MLATSRLVPGIGNLIFDMNIASKFAIAGFCIRNVLHFCLLSQTQATPARRVRRAWPPTAI
jgi:hypothetical protein